MKQSLKTGLSFGLTSGIITTLGLIVGLHSSTHSKAIVVGGILVIAVADALSDALGIHVAEESDEKRTQREIWESTSATFFAKLLTALTFLIPVIFLELSLAIIISVLWGFILIGVFNLYLARQNKKKRLILEHIFIAVLVVFLSYSIGSLINFFLN